MPFPRVYGIPQPHSPYTPGENWIAKDFNWDDGSPVNLFTIPKDYRIITCQIVITTAFNDIDSTLMLGTLAQADRFMTEEENEPNVVGENESNPYYMTPVNTDFYLTINKEGTSQGAGTVLVEFDQPFPIP